MLFGRNQLDPFDFFSVYGSSPFVDTLKILQPRLKESGRIGQWRRVGRISLIDRYLVLIRVVGIEILSVAGYLIDSVLFVLIAFTGTCPAGDLASMILAQYLAKMLLESLFGTPLAYAAVRYIRRRWS